MSSDEWDDDRSRATGTFFRRALIGEGVQRCTLTKNHGWAEGLIGGGGVRMSNSRQWQKVTAQWHTLPDPDIGWVGLAFREHGTGRPLVILSAKSLARILYVAERGAADSGRFEEA